MIGKTLTRAGEDGRIRVISAMVTMVMVLGLVMVGLVAQATHDIGEFELDKNATDNLDVFAVGYLASNISATATTINVCQTGAAPAADDVILIRAERMQITANAAGSFGGNCAGAKRTYSVARGHDGTTARAQSGGANNIGARVSIVHDRDDAAKPGVDWSDVYAAWQSDPATTCDALGLAECTFIPDGIGPTTFIGGNTKDHLPISGWQHTSGASPDKGEILNAYAAKAIEDGGDQILYFGMDRYAVDGSTDIGFWFFQRPVGLNDDGTFSGEQTEGDVLILATFTQGGAATTLRVFEWVDSGGSELPNIDGPDIYGDCVPGTAADFGCSTVNDTTIEVPWTYTFKGESVGGWIPAGGFFEGGINLTEAGLDGCFSSFLAETRSSPELTAVLKDFALGDFEACDSSLTTTPSNAAGTALTDTNSNGLPDIGIGTGSTGANVTDSALLDVKGTDTWSGTLRFYLCGPLESGTCDTGGVPIGTAHSVSSADTSSTYTSEVANLTSVGRYCWRGEFTSATEGVPDASDFSAGECFEVLPVTPTLSTQVVDATQAVLNPATVSFGQAVYDRATLGGTADGPGTNGPGDANGAYTSIDATNRPAAGGTISFTLVGPGDCTTVATGTGSNPQSGVSVSGDGNYFSAGFTPDSPGAYSWKASYSGDSPNTLGAAHNDTCTDSNENVTVQQLQPTMGTAQRFVPNDSATISVASGAGNLQGTVVFALYVNDASCAGTAAYTSGAIDITTGQGDGFSRTVMSSNTTAYSTTGTTFHWVVTFTSSNPAHLDVTSPCGNETSSITVNDGTTQPTTGS